MNDSQAVCVLGMHRSGTSAVTRILNLLGVELGPPEHLLASADDNPTGFWEHDTLRILNDELLSIYGGRWDEPPDFPNNWHELPAVANLRRRAKSVISADFGSSHLWGWKDPRNSLTLPFWQSLLPSIRYVICLRNPSDVAQSLARRNSLSHQKSSELWLTYIASAINHTSGAPRLFIFYEDLMRQEEELPNRLANFIGIPRAMRRVTVRKTIQEFIDPSLEHHWSSPADSIESPAIHFSTKALYMVLRSRLGEDLSIGQERGTSLNQLDEALKLLSSQSEEALVEAESSSRVTEIVSERDALQTKVNELELEITSSMERLDNRDRALETVEDKLRRKTKSAETAREELANTHIQLQDLQNEFDNLQLLIAESDKEIDLLGVKAAAVRAELREYERKFEHDAVYVRQLELQLDGMEHSASWRLTKPVRWLKGALRRRLRGVVRLEHQIRPIPHHHLQPIPGSFGTWESTGNDPSFLLETHRGYLLGGWCRININLGFAPDISPNPSLYVDSGRGFNEDEHYLLSATRNGKVRNLVNLPKEALDLRFDPADDRGQFWLGSFRIQEIGAFEAVLLHAFQRVFYRASTEGGFISLLRKTFEEGRRNGYRYLLHQVRGIFSTAQVYDLGLLEQSHGAVAEAELHLAERQTKTLPSSPLISVLIATHNSPPRFLRRAIESVRNQSYQNWEICICDDGSISGETLEVLEESENLDPRIQVEFLEKNQGISIATNRAAMSASGEYLAFLDHDDELHPEALYEVVKALNEDAAYDVIYTDQDKITANEIVTETFYKPDWSPIYLRHVMYIGHLLVVRRKLFEKLTGFDTRFDKVQDYEFMLRVAETKASVKHISAPLYHWRSIPGSIAFGPDEKDGIEESQQAAVQNHLSRVDIRANVTIHPTHRHRLILLPPSDVDTPLVSIIIPTKDAPELIGPCLESIFKQTTYPNYEVVVVDNNTTDEQARFILSKHPIKIVEFDLPFNYSKANNLGVENASGEYIILLNNDTEIVTPDWIEILLFYLQQPQVGVVGPMLIYPDRTVQHAGVVLGIRGTADHIMRGYPSDADGYAGSLSCPREVSAVTGACMMARRNDFLRLGGMQDYYATHYQDLDFCLRLSANGSRAVYVPYAVVIHHEGPSRGSFYDQIDRVLLLDTWGSSIAQGDPFYNPNFSLDAPDYTPRS